MLLVVATTTFVLLAAEGRVCCLWCKPPHLYCWQLKAGYVACTNHHIQYCWQLMVGYVYLWYKPPYSALLAAGGKVCYLCYKPPYLPEYIVELSALHCLMIEKALQDCFYPCWACIKITVFVWLLQLTSHWIDICNILYWKTLQTTIKPFNFHFPWTVFMPTWHGHVYALRNIHICVQFLYAQLWHSCYAIQKTGYVKHQLRGANVS